METFPTVTIFILAGLFPFKYQKSLKKFKCYPFRAIFCIIVLFLLIGCDIYRGYVELCKLQLMYFQRKNSFNIEEVILTLDQLTWIVMHCSNPISMFFKMRGFCKILNSFDHVVQTLVASRFIASPNLPNKKIRRIIITSILCTAICIHLGYKWSKIDSITALLYGVTFAIHFIVSILYEFVFFAKARFYFKSLQNNLKPKYHPKLHIWVTMHQELWKISKMNCKLFGATKMIRLLCANVLMSAYWFYNYDSVMNVCASFAWQATIIPIFSLCWSWNQLDKEVSHLNNI